MPMSYEDQRLYKERTSAIKRQANALEKLADAQYINALATVANMQAEHVEWRPSFVKGLMKRISQIVQVPE